MAKLKESSKNKLKDSSFSSSGSKKPITSSRKSLGSVLMNPAKRKLEGSISFLKSSKSKRKELISYGKVPQIQRVKKTEIEEPTSKFNEKYNIRIEDIHSAIKGIIKYRETNPKLQNQLFDEQVPLFLEISVHKIPKGHSKLLRIPLRNKTLGPDDEICLIVPDVKGIKNAEHEKHVEHYENLLQSKGVTNVKKIMTFHELRTEYETFEQRSRLVDRYDIFLVDGRISGKVVSKCGKPFYKKRKVPTAIKLHVTNLQDHIEKALSKTILNLHLKSAAYSVQFGHTKMESDKLTENLIGVVEFLDSNFPGSFANIKSMHMFAPRSTSFPVYVSLESPGSLRVPTVKTKKPKAYKSYSGELTTQLNTEVTVQPSGKVILSRVKDESVGKSLLVAEKAVKNGLDKSKKHKESKIGDESPEITELTAEKKKSKKKRAKSEGYAADEVMHSNVHEQQNKKHKKNKTIHDAMLATTGQTTAKEESKKTKKTKTEKYASSEIMQSSLDVQQNITEDVQPIKRKKVASAKVFENQSVDEDIEQTDLPIEKPKKRRMKPIQVGEWTITEDDGENQPRKSKKNKKKLDAALQGNEGIKKVARLQ